MDSHHAGGASGGDTGSSSKLPVKGSAHRKAPSSTAPRPSSDGASVGDDVKGRARASAEGGRDGGRGGAEEGGRVGRGGSGRGEGESEGSIEGVSNSSLQKDADDGRVLRNAEGAAGEGEGPEGESELLLPLEQRNGLMVLRLRSHGSIAGPAFGFPGLGAVQEVTVGAPGDGLEGRFWMESGQGHVNLARFEVESLHIFCTPHTQLHAP